MAVWSDPAVLAATASARARRVVEPAARTVLDAEPFATLTSPVRLAVTDRLRTTLGGELDVSDPPGDPGLFGPESVTWVVHSDLPGMLIGGLSALFLQSLHPGAMAGVAEHSDYRVDPFGRLRRTGAFVAATTYGSTATALSHIAAVRAIHDRVTGTRPDGEPYSANDPELLTWVHITEVRQFLAGFQRFGPRPVTSVDADRYVAEMATIAVRLGAGGVPIGWGELESRMAGFRQDLYFGQHAAEARRFLLTPQGRTAPDRAVSSTLIAAALSLLPEWARSMLDLRQSTEQIVAQPAASALAAVLRWSLGPNQLREAAERRARAAAA